MIKRVLFFLLILNICPVRADFVSAEEAFKERRFAEAFKSFSLEAEKGDFRSQYYLAYQYLYGLGVNKNIELGLKYLNYSAEQDYAPAQALLGFLYDEGKIVPVDKKRAIGFYRKAVELNSTFAILNLGLAYYKGDGVIKNDEQAIELLKQVPLNEQPIAGRYLGEIYLSNASLPDRYSNAIQAYSGSARNDDIPSFYSLGQIYSRSDSGVTDFGRALNYYTYAASKGYEPAQYLLGTMYVNGNNVERNLYLGHAWLELAANKHYQPALLALKELEEDMTISDKERANKELIRIQREVIDNFESPFIAEQKKAAEVENQQQQGPITHVRGGRRRR